MHSNILSRLPRELIKQVYLHLDCHSIKALMSAFPWIVDDFLVISDLPMDFELTPFFFQQKGLKIVRLRDYCPLIHLRGRFIALFELVEFDGTERVAFRKAHNFTHNGADLPFMNKESFVYYGCHFQGALQGIKLEAYWKKSGATLLIEDERLYRHENICGFSQWPKGIPKTVYAFHKYQFGGIKFVKEMELFGIDDVSNLRLPKLKHLTIHFPKYSDHQPTITHIEARGLHTLRVFYGVEFPHMELLSFGSAEFKPTEEWDTENMKLLEFVQTEAATSSITEPLPSCSTSIADMRLIDLGFSKNFNMHHVVGGHDCILRLLDFSNCQELVWSQKNWQVTKPITRLNNTEKIINLSIETILPTFKAPIIPTSNLTQVLLITHAICNDFAGVLDNSFEKLNDLGVWCYDSPNLGTEKRYRKQHIVVPGNVLLTNAKAPYFINLVGAELDKNLARCPYSFGVQIMTLRNMKGPYAHIDNDPERWFSVE